MNADVKNALSMLNKVYMMFQHKGKSLAKNEVKAILEFAVKKGYESTGDIPDSEVEKILADLQIRKIPESKIIDDLFI